MTSAFFRRGPLAAAASLWLAISSGTAQELSGRDLVGATIAAQWQNGDGLVSRGEDGKIVYLYGLAQPVVLCSPLQVCDIELEAGEAVRDVLLGDTVRWKVEPASSGSAEAQAVHLIVKPAEPGLETSMVVTTSRRTYHIQLKSHFSQYMARVGFSYPQSPQERLSDINARIEASVMPVVGLPADQLDFDFTTSGTAPWRPTRIFSDGQKTYIQFPNHLRGQDAPVLFVMSGGENRIVNYRLNGTMMVVDYRIDHAVLVSGVGSRQQKIILRRGG